MIKINKVLLCIYFSFYIQHFKATLSIEQPSQQLAQVPTPVEESELDIFFDETNDFTLCTTQPKIVNPKKTRYVQLQNRFCNCGIMFFLYYLHFKERWQQLCAQVHKKVHKIICYLMYCS